MCNPIAMAIVAAATTAASIRQSNINADAATKTASVQANNEVAALNMKQKQEEAAASQRATATELRAAQAASAARVSAGEAGVSGTGVNRVVGDIASQASSAQAVTNRNLINRTISIANQQQSVEAQRDATIAQAQAQKTGGLEAVIKIGAAAFGGYSSGQSIFGTAGQRAQAAEVAASQGKEVNMFGGTGGFKEFFTGEFKLAPEVLASERAQRTGFTDDFLEGGFIKRKTERVQSSIGNILSERASVGSNINQLSSQLDNTIRYNNSAKSLLGFDDEEADLGSYIGVN